MKDFNLDPYFAAQDSGLTSQESPSTIWSSLDLKDAQRKQELSVKAQQKRQALEALRQQRDQEQAMYEESWAGQLDLNPDSVAGTAVNLGASVVSGASRVLGELTTVGPDLYAAAQEALIPNDVKSAYVRVQNGEATDADHALLDQTGFEDGLTPQDLTVAQDERPVAERGETYRDRLDKVASAREWASGKMDTFDLTGIVEQTNRREFSAQLAEGSSEGLASLKKAVQAYENDDLSGLVSEGVSGLASLLVNAGEGILDNPAAVAEYTMEMLPQVAIGAVSTPLLTAQTVGYGAGMYREGILRYQEQNNGEFPPDDVRNNMAMHAAGIIFADRLGTQSVVKQMGLRPKPQKDFTKPEETKGLKAVGKSTEKATRTEAVTEGYQAYGEGQASYDPATAEEIYESFVIGGAVGGSLAGTGSSVSEGRRAIAEATGNTEEQQQERRVEARAADEAIVEKIREGDIDTLTDPENIKKYPTDRVAMALYTAATQENAAPEQVEAAQQALAKLSSKLDNAVTVAEDAASGLDKDSKAKIKDNIRKYKVLQEKKVADGASREEIQALEDERKSLEAVLKEASNLPLAEQKARKDNLKTLKAAQALATKNLDSASSATQSEEVQASFKTSVDPTAAPEARKAAATKTVTALMAGNQSLTSEELTQLEQDAADVMGDAEKSYLRTLSDATVARNAAATLETTSRDVFDTKAKDGFKSLPTYQRQVATALKAGDIDGAEKQLESLSEWATSHQRKAELAQEAKAQTAPGKQMAIWNDPTAKGGWALRPHLPVDDRKLRKNGGLSFSTGSSDLVNAIQTEAAAIQGTLNELQAAIKVARGGNAPVSRTPTQPTSEAPRTGTTEGSPTTEPTGTQTGTVETSTTDSEPGDAETPPTTQTSEESSPEATPPSEPETVPTVQDDTSTSSDGGEATGAYGLTFTPIEGQLGQAAFESTNLVEAYYTVRKTADNAQSLRPLSNQENFLSTVLEPAVTGEVDGSGALAPYTTVLAPVDSDVGQSQRKQLRHFAEFAKQSNAYIRDNMTEKNRRFWHEDYLQYFRGQDGVVPENVLTALAFAGYTWLVENGGMPTIKSEKDVRRMLGLNPNDPLDPVHYAELRDMGDIRALAIQDLGRKAVNALGLKLRSDAPVNTQSQLETSLGGHIVAFLNNNGYVTTTAKRTTAFGEKASKEPVRFLRPKMNEEGDGVVEPVEDILERAKNTQNSLDKLFDVESGLVWPSFSPITEMTQRKAKRTQQDIPKEQSQIVADEMANKAWMVDHHMKRALDRLQQAMPGDARRLLVRMGGALDERRHTFMAAKEKGHRGKREAVERELDMMFQFYNLPEFRDTRGQVDLSKKFYFPLSVWSNQRVGMATNTVDPLSSKVQRSLVKMADWEHTVPLVPDDVDSSGNHKLTHFKLAVMEGLGLNVDKRSNETALNDWHSNYMDAQGNIIDPELRRMVSIAMELVEDTGQALSPATMEQFADYVAGAEGFHTLDALMHLARYQLAMAWGDTEFRSTLTREGDGITNGPALATILTGAWPSMKDGLALVNKMGFFEQGNPYQSAGEWQEAKENNDLYQTLAHRVDQLVNQRLSQLSPDSPIAQKYNAVFQILGNFTDDGGVTGKGRKRVKTPLTGMAFGASVPKSIQNMGHDVVDVFYDEVESVLNNGKPKAEQQAAIDTLVNALNQLLDKPLKPQTIKSIQKQELTKSQREAVVNSFVQTVGTAVKQSLEEQYGPSDDTNTFLGFRTMLNDVSKDAFDLFVLTRDYEIRQYLAELDKAGQLPKDRDGAGLQDLTGKQLQELDNRIKAINPVVHTAMSKASKQRSAGLHMGKMKMASRYGESAYKVNVSFKNFMPIEGETSGRSGNTDRLKSLQTYGQGMQYQDPGVRVFITNVHALDSAIASRTYKDFPALNVHDAEVVPAYMMQEVATQMNKATFEGLLAHSLPEEIMTTAFRSFLEFRDRYPGMSQETQFNEEMKKRLSRKSGKTSGFAGIRERMAKAFTASDAAEARKLDLMSELSVVNQYGVQGGEYHLTAEDYTDIEERRASSVTDRVMATVANQFRGEQHRLDEALRELTPITMTPTGPATAEQRTLNRIHREFLKHGDLDKAIQRNVVGPQERQKWQTKINQQLVTSVSPLRSVAQASYGEVLRLADDLLRYPNTPQTIRDALAGYQAYVQDPANKVEGTLTQQIARANDLTAAEAAPVTAYLERHFTQRKESPWGRLGKPVAASDPALVKAFSQKAVMPVKDALRLLDQTPLVQQLQKLVNPELRAHYVTARTPARLIPDVDVTKARGFWTRQVNGEAIYVKSPEFVESSANAELLTHETLHAVLHDTIEAGMTGKGRAGAFVKELEQLRAKTIEYLNDQGLMGTYGQAVMNVHELVSWGMTNQDFQHNVLGKVEFQTRNQGLVSGMKTFLQSLARAIFGKRDYKGTGLSTLVLNTAGLMGEANQAQQHVETVTHKQEFGPSPESVQNWTPEQVYQAITVNQPLDKVTDTRLRELLSTIVQKVHGPSGAWVSPDGLSSAAEVYTEAKNTGKLPFASSARTAFPLNDKQAFVLEQVELSLREAMASDTLAYKDLARMFQTAKRRIKPSDLDAHDTDSGEAKYRMLFDLKHVPGSNRTDHLSRFAALALVEPSVYGLLNQQDDLDTTRANGMGDQLKQWFDRSTLQLSHHLNKTHNSQPVNDRIKALSQGLADIHARNAADAARASLSVVDSLEASGKKLGDKVRGTLTSVAESDAVQNSGSGYVQGIGALTSVIAENRVEELLDTLEEYRAWQFKQRQGLVGSMISELRGATENTQAFHELLRHAGQNERNRKQVNENVKRDVRERFVSLTEDESAAFTRTVLRTDMPALLPHYSMERLETLMTNPRALATEIRKWEDRVAALGHHTNHYHSYSKLLGYFLASGKARGPHMSLNAHNIANLYGTTDSVTPAQAKAAEKVIDPLVSLYALQYTKDETREQAAAIFKRENPRQKESGALYAMKLHEAMKAQALDTLFDGDKSLFMKGYTREIYNPHREVVIATAEEGAELVAQGWIQQPKHLVPDDVDPEGGVEKFLFMLPHGGLQAQVTGAMSYTGMRRKGTAIHGGEWLVSEQEVHRENQQTNALMASQNYKRVQMVSRYGRALSPNLEHKNYLVPVYNQHGDIVNYRYLMSETNKDEILERNNRVEDILGSMASHMLDKNTSQDHNRQVVQALKDQYDADYTRHPEAYIKLGPDSEDKQARETYHLLPNDTKQAIRDVWGGSSAWVRADTIDMVFGYRKMSLSNMFDRPEVENRIVNAIMNSLVDLLDSRYFFNGKGKLRTRQVEDAWQEIVKEVKDAWVIKNLTTLMGNIASNVSILLWNGMNPKKIVETHKTAINGLLQYQTDTDELMTLEREHSLGLSSNARATEQRILELKDAIDRNPVKELIDEGLFQTILEDVDAESDDYSYKSRLVEGVSDATASLPKSAKTAARWAYMAHDTPLYKLLFKGTQMSDFVARYSLYQHLTTRKDDPLAHTDAVQRIVDTFVNYDIPAHRMVQYLNDTGVVFFTKYYLRIQKVLMNLFQEKPARGMALVLANNYFSGLPTVVDSLPRLSNPLDVGALNYPGSLTEILPVKAALSLW